MWEKELLVKKLVFQLAWVLFPNWQVHSQLVLMQSPEEEINSVLISFLSSSFSVDDHYFSAQRLALPAWGGRVDSPSKRDSAQARKMPKNAPRTPSRVHALFGGTGRRLLIL
jgi:hypothetical protein